MGIHRTRLAAPLPLLILEQPSAATDTLPCTLQLLICSSSALLTPALDRPAVPCLCTELAGRAGHAVGCGGCRL
eukprot:961747-Rhodomonas_salina.2